MIGRLAAVLIVAWAGGCERDRPSGQADPAATESAAERIDQLRALPYVGWAREEADPGESGVVRYDQERSYPGYNLYTNHELWEDLIGSRKNALKQALRIGLGTLVKLLLRRLSLAEAEERVAKAMGLTGRAVLVRHAELAMDVDKPFQLEICRRELAGR